MFTKMLTVGLFTVVLLSATSNQSASGAEDKRTKPYTRINPKALEGEFFWRESGLNLELRFRSSLSEEDFAVNADNSDPKCLEEINKSLENGSGATLKVKLTGKSSIADGMVMVDTYVDLEKQKEVSKGLAWFDKMRYPAATETALTSPVLSEAKVNVFAEGGQLGSLSQEMVVCYYQCIPECGRYEKFSHAIFKSKSVPSGLGEEEIKRRLPCSPAEFGNICRDGLRPTSAFKWDINCQ